MDPKGILSLSLLLFLSLAFELSYGTGEGVMNCPRILQQLGSNTMLPLTHERIDKSMNKSLHIVVTMAKSRDSSVKKKIVSLRPSEVDSLHYLEAGYQFHLENLSLGILRSRKENEGWYLMSLEENVSVQHFCVELKLYGSRQWGLYAGLFLGGIVGVVMIIEVVIQLLSRRGKANHFQPPKEEKSLTIYAQVQKSGPAQKEPEPLPDQDPCTTIYVAATEPVLESIQEQNPITVYASVTLPES
ncbi:signaling lymphocytic activation molecule isoform X2 [Castor canadensis]|uniref:Signaling lymphocytic activation molecule isoform X2 n=1 Tax=Castor canadensis TaxID=51338 RepID=A0AC58KFU6_CASCN